MERRMLTLTVDQKRAWKSYKQHHGSAADKLRFLDCYQGTFENPTAYAVHYLTSVEGVKEKWLRYFDTERWIDDAVVRDIVILEDEDVIHVFTT
jgi:hypothetical protein